MFWFIDFVVWVFVLGVTVLVWLIGVNVFVVVVLCLLNCFEVACLFVLLLWIDFLLWDYFALFTYLWVRFALCVLIDCGLLIAYCVSPMF